MPKPLTSPRREQIRKHKGQDRLDDYIVNPGPLEWLVDMVHDAGGFREEFTMNGVEILSLTWREVYYWTECVGVELAPFWKREIIKLSGILASQITKSRDLECEVPYQPD